MGTVWRVQHVHTLQHFAIKTLHPRYALSERACSRFLREARLTAAIESPHVVRVIDLRVGHLHQGQPLPFLVMELVEGPSLAEVLSAHGRIGPSELLGVLQQVCEGLTRAHARGIVHRDLKPSNIIIARSATGNQLVKLCDFGIAKLRAAERLEHQEIAPPSTDTGSISGTPRYMAPEQLTRTGRVVAATDQWALALTAFRCLAGHDYFDAARNGVELVLAIVHETLSAPSCLSREVTSKFDAWFLRSCARDPADRFPSVAAQLEALQAALESPTPKTVDLPTGTWVTAPRADSKRSVDERFEREAHTSGSLPWNRLSYVFAVAAGLLAILGTTWISGRVHSRLLLDSANARTVQARHDPDSAPSAWCEASQREVVALPPSVTEPKQASSEPPLTGVHDPVVRAALSKPQLYLPNKSNQASRAERLLPLGASCTRSAECERGVCLAELCQ